MNNKLIFIFLSLLSWNIYSLGIDKVLSARFLDISKSKRTVLIDRGIEDELEVGDHAKFSDEKGMFARGIVSKLAPSRSVWSIYRTWDESKVVKNKSFKIKITTPVKLTSDETKNLGNLAKEYGKKDVPLRKKTDRKFEKKQDVLGKTIDRSTRKVVKNEKADFSILNEKSTSSKKRNPDIDWSVLDGKKDREKVDSGVDYSNLR